MSEHEQQQQQQHLDEQDRAEESTPLRAENRSSSDEDDDMEGLPQQARRMHFDTQFIRLMSAFISVGASTEIHTNQELLEQLRMRRALHSTRVQNAMSRLSRGDFVPEDQKGEAFYDCPIHLPRYNFNISAPHMYATVLEELNIEYGDRVLDVGSGCGYFTALGSWLACYEYDADSDIVSSRKGRGICVGIDIQQDIVSFGRRNVRATLGKLLPTARWSIGLHNVLLPTFDFADDGMFDKIHVSAAITDEMIGPIMILLAEGGTAVFPCGSELLKCTRKDGTLQFSSPWGHKARKGSNGLALKRSETYSTASIASVGSPPQGGDDMAECSTGFRKRKLKVPSPSSNGDDCENVNRMRGISVSSTDVEDNWEEDDAVRHPREQKRREEFIAWWNRMRTGLPSHSYETKVISNVRYGDLVPPDSAMTMHARFELERLYFSRIHVTPPLTALEQKDLTDASRELEDCEIFLAGGEMPLAKCHRSILRRRCPMMRARFDSGMMDANDSKIVLDYPGADAMLARAFIDFMYKDSMPVGLDADKMILLLGMSNYYAVNRLTEMLEERLSKEINADTVVELLVAADMHGAYQLQNACISFILDNYATMRHDGRLNELPPSLMLAITDEAARQLSEIRSLNGGLQICIHDEW
eukprot:Clim_evm82s109 gene=Clim_evmTU82s109